jgi:tRNA threonylcarbamoyladenosine biosynthesis protein TsaB
VALVEDGLTLCMLTHERENAHVESIQPLIQQALAEAGWSSTALDRIAVGTGPGSFTGLRVGIALAQGISEGLEVPLIGVSSLRAMALAAPSSRAGLRGAVLDARRNELFVGVYTARGVELRPAHLLTGAAGLAELVRELDAGIVFLGTPAVLDSVPDLDVLHSPETDLPHARWIALAARDMPTPATVVPLYVRHAVAIIPRLPPNPLVEAGREL